VLVAGCEKAHEALLQSFRQTSQAYDSLDGLGVAGQAQDRRGSDHEVGLAWGTSLALEAGVVPPGTLRSAPTWVEPEG
jgi:hypothetical protein